MDERVAKLRTSRDANKLAENARRLGQLELAASALSRASELRAMEEGFVSPAERAIAAALYAYEEQQSEVKDRSFRANRTRQMLARHGAVAAAERMVLHRRPSKGFEVLEEAGLQELSFEAIILRFPNEFSELAVEAARARLSGEPPPAHSVSRLSGQSSKLASVTELPVVVAMPDAEAQAFILGFQNPDSSFVARWLPNYRETVDQIAEAMAQNRPQDVFETIWKSADNSISNAGQGLLDFHVVDGMREELVDVVREIYEDGSPAKFSEIVARFEEWRSDGRTAKVPRLLIARAFAGIHPDRYHTTVDANKHNQVLTWFSDHTGFKIPGDSSWADAAQALVSHLDQLGLVGVEKLARNMFPWFVFLQLRARTSLTGIKPGHSPRVTTAFAEMPAVRRALKLRHNALQTALYERLVAEYGESNVWTEFPTGTGGFADAIARGQQGARHLFEIKIADNASEIVRQAMGQLLEYGFRPGGLEPSKLFAVGEPPLDAVTSEFLGRLRNDFRLEIHYLQINAPTAKDV